jgi:hypothetical protein
MSKYGQKDLNDHQPIKCHVENDNIIICLTLKIKILDKSLTKVDLYYIKTQKAIEVIT